MVLASIGSMLKEHVRISDMAFRYGGEEFTVLLPDGDTATGIERAETIRNAAHELHLHYNGKTLPHVTLSLGVAHYPLHGTTDAALLDAADAALYRSKQGGRDRVESAGAALTLHNQ